MNGVLQANRKSWQVLVQYCRENGGDEEFTKTGKSSGTDINDSLNPTQANSIMRQLWAVWHMCWQACKKYFLQECHTAMELEWNLKSTRLSLNQLVGTLWIELLHYLDIGVDSYTTLSLCRSRDRSGPHRVINSTLLAQELFINSNIPEYCYL